MSDPYSTFGLSCPEGGKFYICQGNATEFVGCCKDFDPCADGSGKCPKANLQTSSFSADLYDQLPPQDCDDQRGSKIWYTCKYTKSPFMGCCFTNPCGNGECPQEDLVPAKLSQDQNLRQKFLGPSATGPSGPSGTTPASEVSETAAPGGAHLSGGAIAGIVIAVALVLMVVVGAVMYKCGWHARRRTDRETVPPAYSYGGEPAFGNDMSAIASQTVYRDSYNSSATAVGHGHPSPGTPGSYMKHGAYYSPHYDSIPSDGPGSPRMHGYHGYHTRNHSGQGGDFPLHTVSELQAPDYPGELAAGPQTPMMAHSRPDSRPSSRDQSPIPPLPGQLGAVQSGYSTPMGSPRFETVRTQIPDQGFGSPRSTGQRSYKDDCDELHLSAAPNRGEHR